MANYSNVCAAISHIHTCNLHDDERITKCSGTLRRGGICTNNAKRPPAAGVMPTCKIHRRQLKVSAWCTASLPCGYECGRLFEWKPHGFHLCPSHLEDSTTCYFSNIPIEIRCRIYRFLLPDRAIPARFASSVYLTTDWGRVYTAILRVNRQIHEEAANFLYRTRLFSVEVSENTMIMCNLPGGDVQYVRCGSYLCNGYSWFSNTDRTQPSSTGDTINIIAMENLVLLQHTTPSSSLVDRPGPSGTRQLAMDISQQYNLSG